MALSPDHPLAAYANPEEAGRAPSPGPDFTGMTQAETKEHRPRAGERWTRQESEKIQELRNPPKSMPWKQISKIIGKTPLACRLRMNQIKKAEKRARGFVFEPRLKSPRQSAKSKGKKTSTSTTSPPQAPRPLVPAEPQHPVPSLRSFQEGAPIAPMQPSQSRLLPQPATGWGATDVWQRDTYQQMPEQPHQSPPSNLDRLNVLADHASRRLPNLNTPLTVHTHSQAPSESDRQHPAADAAASEAPRKHSTIHDILN
ncbi:hypothetical protein CLAFUW4_04255 [Fulvia fulva]|uniref:Myb-like domain-containing protein n=1 Tax=Passalora fulva TaxID=5499 RepID=A0A9Q8LFR0_PASFU|nr:uncharacterized protein CLAFUR5_04221 [Fulvia fulva]KAK4626499.1 hypothetical protein CLAFUR4_04241 [Fulvia fulva]KAK4628275.1 hypothetical protein CLAFUR0_04243 [Fulvia fulva]UJO16586.1 hypothetical protein CLAFUR5_04221 [Fulvia fulva]WPV13689.1 hypothetical protein CLAFUW4_04255 [Fulvia fulva]WPV28929.1 hypothetical protein CLAFUW7_04244 [Fulvia fulva]